MKRLFDWIVVVKLDGGNKSFSFPTKEAAEKFAQRTAAEGHEVQVQRIPKGVPR